ncbi:MAG: hypothetical protein Q8Q56_05145 [Alphaproteobacteria bacterium]|nr:hypothetical protein [Alphaproteobacteria bacterium]
MVQGCFVSEVKRSWELKYLEYFNRNTFTEGVPAVDQIRDAPYLTLLRSNSVCV